MIRRAVLGLLVVAGAAAGTGAVAPAAGAQPLPRDVGAAARSDLAAGVQLRVLDVSPSAPPRSATKRPLVVTLELTNTTGSTLSGVRVVGQRGAPISAQSQFDTTLADRSPQPSGEEIRPTTPVRLTLPGDGLAHRVQFRTTYGVPTDSGICQCGDGVYPLYFTAERTTAGGSVKRLDVATTMLPSFLSTPRKVKVGWVWPLLDRPHRLTSESVFLDDALATEVAEGGRLDRSLGVVEAVAERGIPVTLVVDPELLDELEVMAGGRYTVDPGGSTPAVAGTGRAAAQTWLARLANLLTARPDLRLALTPYADPDVTSLSLAGLAWHTELPTAIATRIRQALAGRPVDYSLAWPAGGAYPARALTTLARTGVRTALLPTTDVTPRDGAKDGVATGLARLSAAGRTVAVGLLAPALQSQVAASVSRSTVPDLQLQSLLGEIAVRAAAQPRTAHTVLLAPPRYVDPDPTTAVRTIVATSDSTFAQHVSLTDATATSRLPDSRSSLASFPSNTATLSPHVISSASDVSGSLPAITSMLQGGGRAASGVIATLPVALQRTTSSYWLAHPATATAFAAGLVARRDSLIGGVGIVRPCSGGRTREDCGGGVYTLASGSKLPVAVANRLRYPVRVRVSVTADNGLPGFKAQDVGVTVIEPQSQKTLRLQTTLDRSGRIQVEAQLLTPRGQKINGPVSLTVHSTVFGVVGIVITTVAGIVLALALLIRGGRRLLARRRRPDRRPPARTPTPEPAT